MTDTGHVPGEGTPENAGGEAGAHPGALLDSDSVIPGWTPEPSPQPRTTLPGDSGSYMFLDQPDTVDEDDDLLLMPGPQGSWTESGPARQQGQQPPAVAPQPAPPLHPAPQSVVPPSQAPGQLIHDQLGTGEQFTPPEAPAPAGEGAPVPPPVPGGQTAPQTQMSAPQPSPLQQTPAAQQTQSVRRPLHSGPPAPQMGQESTGSVSVRSLADRGPATRVAAPQPAAPDEGQDARREEPAVGLAPAQPLGPVETAAPEASAPQAPESMRAPEGAQLPEGGTPAAGTPMAAPPSAVESPVSEQGEPAAPETPPAPLPAAPSGGSPAEGGPQVVYAAGAGGVVLEQPTLVIPASRVDAFIEDGPLRTAFPLPLPEEASQQPTTPVAPSDQEPAAPAGPAHAADPGPRPEPAAAPPPAPPEPAPPEPAQPESAESEPAQPEPAPAAQAPEPQPAVAEAVPVEAPEPAAESTGPIALGPVVPQQAPAPEPVAVPAAQAPAPAAPAEAAPAQAVPAQEGAAVHPEPAQEGPAAAGPTEAPASEPPTLETHAPEAAAPEAPAPEAAGLESVAVPEPVSGPQAAVEAVGAPVPPPQTAPEGPEALPPEAAQTQPPAPVAAVTPEAPAPAAAVSEGAVSEVVISPAVLSDAAAPASGTAEPGPAEPGIAGAVPVAAAAETAAPEGSQQSGAPKAGLPKHAAVPPAAEPLPAEPAAAEAPAEPGVGKPPAEPAAAGQDAPVGGEGAAPDADPRDGAAPEPQAPRQPAAPAYDEDAREAVHRVIRERRDIRNGFRQDPIPPEVLIRVLEAAHTAPSVGHSQPWDFVVIRSSETRQKMHELAMRQRKVYEASLPKGRAKQFKELKIEAIVDTPVNIVVTADPTRGGRHTLGRHTQPQMAPYSSALAVENLWLAARAEGLGVGWVSFFDEREMVRELGLPDHLEVVAYLCVGYVDEFPDEPELMQAGWSKRRPLSWVVHEEEYGNRSLPGASPLSMLDETLRGIRPLDAKALGEAWERQKRMTKPAGALGMLEIISAQLCGLSRQCPPPVPEPAAVAVFAGDHGVHAQGVTAWPQEVTAQMVQNFLGGGAVVNAFANQVGAEVCVIDVGVAGELPAASGLLPRKVRPGTADFTTGPAMSREDALRAIEVGVETARDLVAAGNKALLTGEMGIANTTVSAALISVYTGVDPAEVTGRGTGINDETHSRKVDVVRRALELHKPDPADPIGVLAAVGGLEHAAMVGLLLGGASLRTPVILDGVSAGAAALVARAIAPEVLAACVAGHRSAEPGHVAALTKLGLRPLIDLDLRLGEGTGALLALPVVQSAARAMHEVATFDSAGVTEKS